jgi:hypothetical protein
MQRTMQRKPEHYPEWLRDLLYEPVTIGNMRAVWTPNPERNWYTLQRILQTSYRTDPRDALLFDMIIEKEREVISQQEKNAAVSAYFTTLTGHVRILEARISMLESKLRGIGDN